MAVSSDSSGALRSLVERVNGFVYAGDRLDAVIKTVEVIGQDADLARLLFPNLFAARRADELKRGAEVKEWR